MLKTLDGGRTRLGVTGRFEVQPVALSRGSIALRPEERPWLGDGEVDVEEDGPKRPASYTPAGHL
jgi:hypothetical protein